MPVCGSPKLFAAYHVLHRLLAPRHSPYALSSLTIVLELEANACRAVADAACDSSLHTAMCVVGKNYRLQDIQLSESDETLSGWPGALPLDQPSNFTIGRRALTSAAE